MPHQWKPAHHGKLTGIHWDVWLCSDRSVDPYLVWADLLKGQNLSTADTASDIRWPVIIELDRSGHYVPQAVLPVCPDPTQAATVPLIFGCMDIPQAYKTKDSASPTQATLATQYITAKVNPLMIEMLLYAAEIKRFQLGLPRLGDGPQGSVIRPGDPISAKEFPRVVIGVIDDGLAFAHPAFRDAQGKTRIRALWDQDPRRVPTQAMAKASWTTVKEFGYGAELSDAELQRATAMTASGDEWAAYEYTDFGRWKLDAQTHASAPLDADGQPLPPAAQLRGSHGQSVAFLAAGYPMPVMAHAPVDEGLKPRQALDLSGRQALVIPMQELAKQRAQSQPPTPGSPPPTPSLASIDTADQWDILFVQLPSRTVADTTGGSLAVHVLDAVRYLQERTLALRYESYVGADTYFPSNQLVVNLSYGSLAGGHDGTSILEQALAERALEHQSCPTSIVTSAGNGHGNRSHATFDLRPGDTGRLVFTVGPDNPLESYLEIWLPDVDVHGLRVRDSLARSLIASVKAPTGAYLAKATIGEAQILESGAGETEAALIGARHVAQSTRGTMLLLAVRSTRTQPGAVRAPTDLHGDWEIEITWASDASEYPPQRVHAWCERNDLVFGVNRAQQARVVDDPPVRDPSEFEPDAIKYLAHGRYTSPDQRPPFGFRPSMSLASVASSEPLDVRDQNGSTYPFLLDNGSGTLVSVGGYRADDGEMSTLSSGGPSRLLGRDVYWDALQGRQHQLRSFRLGPDVDAPSDRNAAVAGLPTAGVLPGSVERLSGTSAAAALYTRTLANVLYWNGFISKEIIDSSVFEKQFLPLLVPGHLSPARDNISRPTLTPVADDAFRKGRLRTGWD